jgi:TPR repeat protein
MSVTPEQLNQIERLAYAGNLKAQFNLGEIYFDLKEFEKSIFWHRRAAENGYADSQCAVGLELYHGVTGWVKVDHYAAVKWYKMATNQGHILAMINLAGCYLGGNGVFKDPVEAFALYYLASKDFSSSYNNICVDIVRKLEVNLNPSQVQAARFRSMEIEALIKSRIYFIT